MKPAALPLLLLITAIHPGLADAPPRYKMTVLPLSFSGRGGIHVPADAALNS